VTTAEQKLSDADRTAAFVSKKIVQIQSQYAGAARPSSTSRATLARLRRGLGKRPGELPDLLEFVVDPDAPAARGDEPTRSEVAAYTALTMYGLHQQSQSRRMHLPGASFGEAVGSLRLTGNDVNAGVVRRFQSLATATDMREFVQHTRGLITLLRSAERGFDYGRFARDLVHFQEPRRADRVRLDWGRDFYRTTPTSDTPEETP